MATPQPAILANLTAHQWYVHLRRAEGADLGVIKTRSTPYAFHDGTVGLCFMGFCKEQAPLRERMKAIYGMHGNPRDVLTDYSTPASGSFSFAPSVETLEAALA